MLVYCLNRIYATASPSFLLSLGFCALVKIKLFIALPYSTINYTIVV